MAHSQLACPLVLLCFLLMLPSVLMQGVRHPWIRKPILVTDETVKELADLAMEQYNERTDCIFCFRMLTILEAEIEELVGGSTYYLTMEVGITLCNKRKSLTSSEIQNCPFPQMTEPEILICDIVAWSGLFPDEKELRSIDCIPAEINMGKGS